MCNNKKLLEIITTIYENGENISTKNLQSEIGFNNDKFLKYMNYLVKMEMIQVGHGSQSLEEHIWLTDKGKEFIE